MDPPFTDNEFVNNLNLIKQNKIYKKKHIVIIHRERGSIDNYGTLIKKIIVKEYGRSKIIFGIFN